MNWRRDHSGVWCSRFSVCCGVWHPEGWTPNELLGSSGCKLVLGFGFIFIRTLAGCGLIKVHAEDPATESEIQRGGLFTKTALAHLLQHPGGLFTGRFVSVVPVENIKIRHRTQGPMAEVEFSVNPRSQCCFRHTHVFGTRQR